MADRVRIALVVLMIVAACGKQASSSIDEFRSVERTCIRTFNDALARQRANQIDELGLADEIDREVLPLWRTMRSHVEAAHDVPERMRPVMLRYLADRQLAWEAYTTGLRAPSDEAARPHYDVYHQKNAEAQADAAQLGPMLGPQ